MAKTALKEKLEEKLCQNEVIVAEIVEEQNNVVPFLKPEQQLCSIVPEFAISLNEAKERIRMLQEFVSEMMIEGIDYGKIPKCDKPSLFKSGAEKLTDIFGFSKQLEIINRIEDWKEEFFHYEIKIILISKRTGLVEAEGIGCCNNRERKYINQHSFSVINTVLKMAKKRALVDAVLSATRSSGLFSQDLEDLEVTDYQASKVNNSSSNTNELEVKNQNASSAQENQKPVTRSQLNKIQALVTEKTIPVNRVKVLINERYRVPESKMMSLKQADDFIKYLINYNER